MSLAPLIKDLAMILGVAALVTLIFQRIRQPVVLGYIVAGLVVGPLIADRHGIQEWAELGIVFLMFSLGLEFSFRKLAKVGVSAASTAVLEVSLMIGLGFATGKFLKWSNLDSVFLGAMMSISSTTIIIKALDELKLKSRRFAELIFGVLIVEDLIAVLILVGLSTFALSSSFSGLVLITAAGKLVLVVGSWFLAGYFLLPRFVRYVGKLGNDEMLTILSLGLCLSLVVLANYLNYSAALGAFIMGSILAESSESYRIEELIRPLRDLFSAIFFVSVGMLIEPHLLWTHRGAILLISSVLIVGKIVNITLGSLITGQTLRTSVQVGFGMAQVGEFSFIIATLGQSLHITSHFLYPVAVAVSVLTTFTTPYLIRVSHKFAVFLESKLPVRVKNVLSQYAAWTQERRADNQRRADFYRRVLRFILNGILVIVAYVVVAEVLLTRFSISPVVGWVVATLFSAPFIWGMFFSFKDFRFGQTQEAGGASILFASRLIAVFVIGALSLEFFSTKSAVLLTSGLSGLLFFIFHRRLGESYRWFELRFLSTFEEKSKSKRSTDVFRHLAPWDAHLVRFKVHPNAELSGQRLIDSDLRARYGLNVVVIQRGLKTIVAPSPDERIYPKDELLVLGTDEQVDAARSGIEKPPGLANRFQSLSGYELRQLLIDESSPFKGLTLREAGIREKSGCMVVGLERGDTRTINPASHHKVEVGDVLWVVGETEKLKSVT